MNVYIYVVMMTIFFKYLVIISIKWVSLHFDIIKQNISLIKKRETGEVHSF